jgi:hypothetical protein
MPPQLVGHHSPHVTPLIIAAAVNGGRIATDHREWVEAVENLPGRRDFHTRTVKVAHILALNADDRHLAAPGISNLMRVCGLSERQVYRILRHLRESHLLGWVSTGTTVLKSGNWRATYVLMHPEPPEVSPRVTSPTKTSFARETKPWGTSPAMRYARKVVSNWTDRQFMTAITYPPQQDRTYGPPTGKSAWRIILWRLRQYMTPSSTFQGREATMWTQPPRDAYHAERQADNARVSAEMRKPGAHERVAIHIEMALAAARKDWGRHAELTRDLEALTQSLTPQTLDQA